MLGSVYCYTYVPAYGILLFPLSTLLSWFLKGVFHIRMLCPICGPFAAFSAFIAFFVQASFHFFFFSFLVYLPIFGICNSVGYDSALPVQLVWFYDVFQDNEIHR